MPGKDSEKTETPRQGEATATGKAVVKTQPVSRKESDNRHYTCGCRLCICGGAVEYPGDICSICTRCH